MKRVVVFTVLVPKNKSLESYKEKELNELGLNEKNSKIVEIRGEDIPFWLERLAAGRKKGIGLTGEDLFREYCLSKKGSRLQVIKRITWEDPKAIFGKPFLCLLGPKEKSLESMPKELNVFIVSKYKNIAKRYLNLKEKEGYTFKKKYISGSSECSISVGLCDLIIDVVYTGKSMEQYGLKVYEKIFGSDFVVIGVRR